MNQSILLLLLLSFPIANCFTTICGGDCICQLTYITCRGSAITQIPTVVTGIDLGLIVNFYCSTCNIGTLKANSFAVYTSLEYISIQYSGLIDIEPGAFADIASQLTYLDLSDNAITTIKSHYFTGLTSVNKLELQFNSISELEEGSFTDLTSLDTLLVGDNQISYLPDSIFSTTAIIQFDITNNNLYQLTNKPFPIGITFTTLYFSNNNIARIHSNVSTIFTNAGRVLLNDNPIICDCYILHLQTAILSDASTFGDSSTSATTCGYPANLDGTRLSAAMIFASGCFDLCLNIDCDISATCTVESEWPVCTCNSGYTGNGFVCTDPCDGCFGVAFCVYNSSSMNGSCVCPMGYQLDNTGKNCTEINECIPNLCPINSTCLDLIGDFSCECNAGYSLVTNPSLDCVDINECNNSMLYNCSSNSECVNIHGAYLCECNLGYEMVGMECMDINECLDVSLYNCQPDSTCQNIPSNYSCQCNVGFFESSPNFCGDLNECISTPNICPSNITHCNNTVGSYLCECNLGYENTSGECIDINECLNVSLYDCQPNSTCDNTVGNYTCVCNTGFFESSPNLCADFDECSNTTICPDNSHCNNTVGSYLCECNLGYEDTGTECIDIDECLNVSLYNCQAESTCQNLIGNYTCDCNVGYLGSSPNVCEDINECSLNPNICPVNGHCNNTVGSYLCECDLAYEMVGMECTDINECLNVSLYECQPYSTCQNLIGNYTCDCNTGFVENSPNVCEDINECISTSNICPSNITHCNNTIGSYLCECNLGYEDISGECIDINECLNVSLYDCQPNSTCQNFVGNYFCECNIGFFESSPNFCADFDECSNTTICPDNSHCNNTIGSYICECNLGYEDSSGECIDIDECQDVSLYNCQPNSTCENTVANYTCGCNTGFFESSPNFCADFDECSNTTICPDNSHCNNTMGSYLCECDLGYEDTGTECIDINECLDVSLHECQPNSTCDNIVGNYTCDCNIGYLESFPNVCEDINECSLNPNICPVNGHCNNTVGSYFCECDLGYEDTGTECIDINECLDVSLFQCQPESTCQNIPSNYSCQCNVGFFESSPNFCGDFDECSNTTICPDNSHCNNTIGSYLCECDLGYEDSSGECIDIDECQDVSLYDCQPNSTCENTVGNYTCGCNTGFFESFPNFCADFDECSNTTICPDNSHCNNTIGSYLCECNLGYEDSSGECIDIDECQDVSLYNCQPNSTCENTVANYTCGCNTGFFESSPNFCADFDECSNTTICPDNSHCNNTIGSYLCECDLGYEDTGTECVDINECLNVSLFQCQPNSTCQNIPSNYSCQCNVGFFESSHNFCADFDECSNTTICPDNSHCNNTIGSYLCECDLGYEDTGTECIDIDECLDVSLFQCQPESTCQNLIGNYTCDCNTGFVENSPNVCEDINECISTSNICPSNITHCNNTIGSYLCECNLGYENISGECIDINECLNVSLFMCPLNSNCVNLQGDYDCICDTGFEEIGSLCLDKDECSNGEATCKLHSTCINEIGSFTCVCNSGYEEIQPRCIDINECMIGTANCSINENCTNLPGDFACVLCPSGHTFVNDTCTDVDECALFTDLCLDRGVISGTCLNNNGSYSCVCLDGFESLNTDCVDVNECSFLTSVCHNSAQCNNIINGFNCSCSDPGYAYTDLTNGCQDINECIISPCISREYCINNIGSFDCECLSGYFRDISGFCVDDNECIAQNDLCDRVSTDCVNTVGFYACVCKIGFINNTSNNFVCTDLNECQESVYCGDTASCVNYEGSYSCTCRSGYQLNVLKQCVDINECLINSCPSNSICYNNVGGFNCVCQDGFYPVNINSLFSCEDNLQTPFCATIVQSGFEWSDTATNTTTTIKCPNNGEQFAKRFCNTDGIWNIPDISNCVLIEISMLSNQLNTLSIIDPNFTAVLGEISMELTSVVNSTGLLASDYIKAIEMYQTMTLLSEHYIQIQNSFIPTNIATELFEVASAIVNPSILENIQMFDETAVLTAVSGILSATESLTRNLVYTLFSEGNDTQILIETDNILVDIQRIRTEEGFVVSFNTASGDTTINIPFESINSANFVAFDDSLKNASIENCNTAASFFNIKNIQRFFTQNIVLNFTRFDSWYCEDIEELETPNRIVNSDHLSASIDSTKCYINTDTLKSGFLVVFQHSDLTLINSQCVYTTNYTVAQTGDIEWETITCQKLPMSNQTHTFCNCSHLTSFAILMSPDPYYSSGFGMSIFSYSCLCISILFLVISLGLHFMKLLISEAVLFVHRNFIFSILLSQIIFVLGIERNEWQLPCLLIAALLHYVLLVSFVWMLLEAINALILIKRPFINQLWLKVVYSTIAYLSPLVVVAVTLVVSICDYGHYPLAGGAMAQTATTNCWLPRRNSRYWAFIGPALVIIAVNCVLLFAIITIILRLQFIRKKMVASTMKKSNTETLVKGLASAIKATVLMVPILGITWIFGIFALNSINVFVSQIFQWLFLIFNCNQGVFIFTFYCLLNEEVRSKCQLLILQKILSKRTNREDLKEIGFFQILRGNDIKTRSPILNRKSSRLSAEKEVPNKLRSSVRLNLINVSGGTFGSEDREILSNQLRY